jgi:hypothetical protein
MRLSPEVWSEKCRYLLQPVLNRGCNIESSLKLGLLQGNHAKLAWASNPPKVTVSIDSPSDPDFDRAKQLVRIDVHDFADCGSCPGVQCPSIPMSQLMAC